MKKTKVTDFKTNRIKKLTGGSIQDFEIKDFPGTKSERTLSNSFVAPDGTYIGDYATGWWYVRNNLKVCKDHPLGVAEKYDESGVLTGFLGYTHRGGCTFRKGDRLFDENYKPKKEDYDEAQWGEWEKEFSEKRAAADDFDREMIYTDISAIIPFKLRGSKRIENMVEAKQAAINMSKYLS